MQNLLDMYIEDKQIVEDVKLVILDENIPVSMAIQTAQQIVIDGAKKRLKSFEESITEASSYLIKIAPLFVTITGDRRMILDTVLKIIPQFQNVKTYEMENKQ